VQLAHRPVLRVTPSIAGAAAIGLAMAVAVGVSPLMAIAATAVAIGLAILAVLGRRIDGVSLGVLGVLLAGYALFSRGLAHVGVAPVYVGEMTLALVLVGAIAAIRRSTRLSWLHGVVVLFMLWGALQTIPYLGRYGVDAVRDAVTWGYGLFALAVSLMLTRDRLEVAMRWYGRLLPVFVLWVPIAAVVALTIGDAFAAGPGSEVSLVYFKGGDMGVHLAGVGAFVLLAFDQRSARRIPVPLFWLLWMLDVVVVGVITRGGMFAAVAAFGAFLFSPSVHQFLRPLVIGMILFLVVALVNPSIDLGLERRLSLGQVIDNITSVVGDRGQTNAAEQLQGTKNFRLKWWSAIVDYTVNGPYFWTGKGFGINLADADGFQVTADGSLRAPHNGHVEVLARMGVPGLVLWILLNVGWAWAMLRRAFGDRVRDPFVAGLAAWLFLYWVAMLVNATFDPYLQGPQGGIWYWTIIGAGLFLTTLRTDRTKPAVTSTTPAVTSRAGHASAASS